MKAYWVSRGIAPRILDLSTRWRWVVSFTHQQLYPQERDPGTHWIGGWVGPRDVLEAVVKRKIPSPRREPNPRTPIVQSVAQRYTDWAIAAHSRYRLAVKTLTLPPLTLTCDGFFNQSEMNVEQRCSDNGLYLYSERTWFESRSPYPLPQFIRGVGEFVFSLSLSKCMLQ
jgi:hypothetical protein